MPIFNNTPGIYVEEISPLPRSITGVETAVPAFIGFTRKATGSGGEDLHLLPTRISSMAEYARYFGDAQPESGIVVTIAETRDQNGKQLTLNASALLGEHARSKQIMYYALQMFFANGGGTCRIVSVNPCRPLGEPPLLQDLKNGLDRLANERGITLLVFPEAQYLEHIDDFNALHTAALEQCSTLQDRFVIMDVHGNGKSLSDKNTDLLPVVEAFRNLGIGNANLSYGAAYAPNIETALDFAVDEANIQVIRLLDGTPSLSLTLDELKSADEPAYELAVTAIRNLPCRLPPSAAIAGIYASVDRDRGVWKAPANIALNAVTAPAIEVTQTLQSQCTVDPSGKSINLIRSFPGKGVLVWGARTLAGNSMEWRYVNVRRFFIFVEESVRKGTEAFIFEPNDQNTWSRVRSMIENFLTTLWKAGGLQGMKAEQAFFVRVRLNTTMTALDIREGRMIIEMGLAVARPAEFTILRIILRMETA